MKARESKHISNPKDIEYILSLTESDLLKLSTMMKLFGSFKGKCRFHTYDTITIPAGSYGSETKKNKKPFTTTLGKYLYNKIFIEKDLFDQFHYISKPIGKKQFKKIDRVISHSILEKEIKLDVLKSYLMKGQKLMPLVTAFSQNESEALFVIGDTIAPKKEELLKKYKAQIDAGDDKVISKIEEELIEYAKEKLKDDPSLDLYNSGEGMNYSNHFKNMFIMKGLTKDPDPRKGFNIITSNYMDGVKKEEYSKFANSLAEGPFARARKTATGGYWEKLAIRATQHIILDEPDTDCGTKKTIEFTIEPDNIDEVMYSYIVEGNKLVELTSKNQDKYMGKTVKLRYTSLCQNKNGKICNKCAGNKLYRIGIKNIGCSTPQLFSKLKNLNMKSFHDSQVVFQEMDPMKAFFPFGNKGKQAINEDVSDYGVDVIPLNESIQQDIQYSILNEEGMIE